MKVVFDTNIYVSALVLPGSRGESALQRIVVVADYPEDGTQLLKEAKVELVKLNPDLLKPWLTIIPADPESSAKAVSK